MFRKTIIFIINLSILLSLTSCSSSGGITTFTLGLNEMPKNLDPQVATSNSDVMVITNIFDGLFDVIDGKVENNLVDNYTISNDGLTYTFNLKKDSFYDYSDTSDTSFNKSVVTAQDFVFSFKRIVDASTQSPYFDEFSNIKNATKIHQGDLSIDFLGVTAIDDYTLEITLEKTDYNFIYKLSSTAVMPCNEDFFYFTKGSYGLNPKTILSNGPFKLNYINQEEKAVTIVRSKTTFENPISRIRIKILEPLDSEKAYLDNDISGYFNFNSTKQDFSSTDVISLSCSNSSLFFNLDNEFFKNENIRKSLSYYAFAYQNSGANLDVVSPTYSIFPTDMSFNDDYINNQINKVTPEYLQQEAKELLKIGLKELDTAKLSNITLLIPDDSKFTLIYENINQIWQKNLGQFFNVEKLSTTEIMKRISNNDYDIAFSLFNPSQNNPLNTLAEFTPYNQEIGQLVAAAKITTDVNLTLKNIDQANKLLINTAMITPIGHEYTYYYHKDYFDNVIVNPFGYIINLKYATAK